MLLAHLRAAQREAATARFIDQRPGLVPVRVLEGRSAGLAAQRLAFLARGGDAVHFRLDRGRLAGFAAEGGRHDNRAVDHVGMAIAVMKIAVEQGHLFARAQHHLAFHQYVRGLAAIGAAIHPHEAADRAGDGAEKFETGNAGIPRGRGDEDARRTTAADQGGGVQRLHLGEGLAQAHDHARHAAIANDQVGAKAERHHRHRRIEHGQEIGQVVGILGLEQPLRRPARLEPDERCQRRIGLERAANGRESSHHRQPRTPQRFIQLFIAFMPASPA